MSENVCQSAQAAKTKAGEKPLSLSVVFLHSDSGRAMLEDKLVFGCGGGQREKYADTQTQRRDRIGRQ